MSNSTIRVGTKDDLPRVLELIKELAAFEKAPHEVINTLSAVNTVERFAPELVKVARQ